MDGVGGSENTNGSIVTGGLGGLDGSKEQMNWDERIERVAQNEWNDRNGNDRIMQNAQEERKMQGVQNGHAVLTHFNEQQRARMVDVSDKPPTKRSATAKTTVSMKPATLDLIKQGKISKGDVLAVAQVAGIMAAKQTSAWIPMCHPLALSGVDIVFDDNGVDRLYIEATVKTTGLTGVEMEALTAVSAAALTVYDMCKAAEKQMEIGPTMLLSKTGGKGGDFHRDM